MGSRHRPALIVSVETFPRKLLDVVVCPVSNQPRFFQQPGPRDHPLKHWKTVGLHHPSTVRISNILALDKKLIKRVLGTLHEQNLTAVEQSLRDAFGPQR